MEQDSSEKHSWGQGYNDGHDDMRRATVLQEQCGKRMDRPLKTYQDRIIYYLNLNLDDWISRTEQARAQWDANQVQLGCDWHRDNMYQSMTF